MSASSAPSASSIPARTAPRRPAATSSAVPGSRCGCHARPECLSGGGSGERSNSTVARSMPAMPSIREWWVFVISAKRSSLRPSISHISHSGLERSSCWEKIRAVEALQLLPAARRRQRGVADVVLEVEVRVVDPHRASAVERCVRRACGGSAAPGAAAGGSVRGSPPSTAAGPRRSSARRRACARSVPPGAGRRRRPG